MTRNKSTYGAARPAIRRTKHGDIVDAGSSSVHTLAIQLGREVAERGASTRALSWAAALDVQAMEAARARAERASTPARRVSVWTFAEAESQALGMAVLRGVESGRQDVDGYAVPNQAAVSTAQRRELARSGMVAGVPDVAVEIGERAIHVEWKAPGGAASDDQIAYFERAARRGVPCYLVYSVAEWVQVLAAELGGRRGPEAMRDPRRKVPRPR